MSSTDSCWDFGRCSVQGVLPRALPQPPQTGGSQTGTGSTCSIRPTVSLLADWSLSWQPPRIRYSSVLVFGPARRWSRWFAHAPSVSSTGSPGTVWSWNSSGFRATCPYWNGLSLLSVLATCPSCWKTCPIRLMLSETFLNSAPSSLGYSSLGSHSWLTHLWINWTRPWLSSLFGNSNGPYLCSQERAKPGDHVLQTGVETMG